MANNRPLGREKNVTGAGKSVYKRGSGQGTGPVGNVPGSTPGSGNKRSTGKGGKSPIITGIIVLLALLFGGKTVLGGESSDTVNTVPADTQKPIYVYSQPSSHSSYPSSSYSSSSSYGSSYSSMPDSLYGSVNSGSVSSGWALANNTGRLDTTVDAAARPKRTAIFGNGVDTVTVMVYMCGTDLESQSGMATNDLMEMTKANIADNVNVIVYTGGCKRWQNSVVSSSVNQIYKVQSGGLKLLESNAGTASMTKPSTLADFIKYCDRNYPANRNELILWDHGGGSLSGYGYDQKYQSSGSMKLSGIQQALDYGGVDFDFIGFDACLMATTETAIAVAPYADYLIASEETEPGVGWYYTNWLNEISKNTSAPTLQIGRKIVDDYVDVCASTCRGQKTTLALIDLAELEETLTEDFRDFAVSTTELIENDGYKTVSDARSGAREFSSGDIDQVDLVHLASAIGTDEADYLSETILSAVKYNRTSSNMTNAYGLSIYFPYRKVSSVDSAVETYKEVGVDDEYSRCIQAFASVETGGQAMSGGMSSPYSSLFDFFTGSSDSYYGSNSYGNSYGGSSYGGSNSYGSSYGSSYGYGSSYSDSSAYSYDALVDMLDSLLGGSLFRVSGLTDSNSGYLARSLDTDDVKNTAQFLSDNRFDPGALTWTDREGVPTMELDEKQWSLVHELELNVFLDDGEGFIDMGLDNSFEFTDDGALIGQYDGTWTAIDGQPVAYYHVDTVTDGDSYTITGRVPVLLNGDRAELILVFDNDHPYGFIAGARSVYINGETETVAKGMTELKKGDTLDFLCDYYSYEGEYTDSYMLGDPMTVETSMEDMEISYVYVDADAALATYRFTDIYAQEYWSPVLES
ncbi:MAG: clostripain-related cysteine peptidase [Eubacteriales bacterium]|nr:clostripain-related cysteine peptidase [Eubacteriales bacterium]